MKKRVSDVRVGDVLDLEGDRYADPKRCSTRNEVSDHPEFESEFQTVVEIEHEGPYCIVLHFDGFSCGFPTYHEIECGFPIRSTRLPAKPPHDVAALLCRAAAAIETPADLTAEELNHVVEDLLECAKAINESESVAPSERAETQTGKGIGD